MPTELAETDVFILLSDRRRRRALQILWECTTPLAVSELTELIWKREDEGSLVDTMHAINVSLHHHHLPILDHADVIEYDRQRGTVSPGLNFDLLMDVLGGYSDRDTARTRQ